MRTAHFIRILTVLVIAGCAKASHLQIGQAAPSLPAVEVGDLQGAPYRIDVPRNWNGGLVIHCHGYRGAPVHFDAQKQDQVADTFRPLGYAVAQSGYSTGGYAIREAAVETEALRLHFVTKYGPPSETWVTGSSLGGSITMMLMELHPTTYDGGLSLCAPLGPAAA